MLALLRLPTAINSSHPVVQDLNLIDPEIAAIYSSTDVLHGEEGPAKNEIVAGLLSGEGEFQGVPRKCLWSYFQVTPSPAPDSRLIEITRTYISPPVEVQAEEPPAETEVPADEPELDAGPTATANGGGNILFMQESELDAEGKPVEEQQAAFDPNQVTFISEDITILEGGDTIQETVVVSSHSPFIVSRF